MTKRKQLTKAQRQQIWQKLNGHCAYCGCELPIDKMAVDHVISLHIGGADKMENMLPSCRSCNYYKGTLTLEMFREAVGRFHSVLMRDSVTYKNAVRFGQVVPKPHGVVFYFERQECEDGE